MSSPDHGPGPTYVSPRVERTRNRALIAARQILLDEGWEALTQRRVAEVAGIGRATVYRHWPDRICLLQEACAAEVTTLHTIPSGDLRKDLCAELTSMRHELIDGQFDKVLLALTDRCLWEPEMLAVKKATVDSGTANLRRILTDAVVRQDLPADLDTDEAIAYLIAPMLYRHLFADQTVNDITLECTVDDFLQLRQPPARSPAPG